jgi:hypothetical protein
MKDRFAKLANLTRGAAVVSLGVGASYVAASTGCTKSEPTSPPPVTADAIQADPAAADPGDGGPFHGRRRFPIPNAMHPRLRFGDGGGPSDGGANDGP